MIKKIYNIKTIFFILILILMLILYYSRFDIINFVQYSNIQNFYYEREPKNNSDVTILHSSKDDKYSYYITEKYTGEGEKDCVLFVMDKFKVVGYYSFSFPQSPIFSTFYFNIGNKTIVFGDSKTSGWNQKSELIEADLDMILLYFKGNKIASANLPEKENIYLFTFNNLLHFDYAEVTSNGVIVSNSKEALLKKIEIRDF